MTVCAPRHLAAVTCVSVLLAALAATPLHAQAIHEGKLTGSVVSDDRTAVPGATVEISSPSLMAGTRSAVTSAAGSYVFLNLPAGRYTVTASLGGFKTVVRENIAVGADATTTLDLVLPVGAVKETVTVTGEPPVVDVKSATVDARIDQELLSKLPTTRDAFYDLALTTPGMSEGSGSQSLPSPTAYGSSTNENVFLINGVNATNPEAGSFGTLVNVNYDAVEEVRIVGLGSKAEYGSFSGAAVDVMTKSGSNQFHGSGAIYSLLGSPSSNQPGVGDDLGAPWLFVGEGEQLAGETKKDWEGSGTVGGPIRKDKLWFFGAYDYLRSSSLPPRWSLENESWNHYADGKISAVPFKNHLIWGSYHYENNDGNGWSWGSEPAWDTSMTYGVKTKNHTAAAPVAVLTHRKHVRKRQVPWILERRKPVPSRDAASIIPATSTGGSGPTTASTARSRTSTRRRQAATRSRSISRTMPKGSSVRTTSSSASSTRKDAAIARKATSRTTSTSSTRTAGRRTSSTCRTRTATTDCSSTTIAIRSIRS